VLINGIPFEHLRKWYVKHSGYVLQLAVPYYEELTVRQNLLLAALMRLPKSMSPEMRFERVERIIQQIGLTIVEDTVVGGSTGPGLSGGQVILLFRQLVCWSGCDITVSGFLLEKAIGCSYSVAGLA
jgi:ABC-type multidrug transport system ATPase subunit